jgi:hypothetical protein
MCMQSENESASHSSPPQLKGDCVCLSAGPHRDTNTHTHTKATLKGQDSTCQVMIENQHIHSSPASQYSATRNSHTHWRDESPTKRSGGRTDNWLLFKPRYLYRGEIEIKTTSCKVNSTKQTKKEQIFTYTETQVPRWHIWLYEERERIRVRQLSGILRKANKHENLSILRKANKHAYLCVCVCICVSGARALFR